MLRQGEETDSDEKKAAIAYLEEALKKKNDFITKTVATLPAQVSKEDFVNKIKDNFFASHKLRVAITGRQVLPKISGNIAAGGANAHLAVGK